MPFGNHSLVSGLHEIEVTDSAITGYLVLAVMVPGDDQMGRLVGTLSPSRPLGNSARPSGQEIAFEGFLWFWGPGERYLRMETGNNQEFCCGSRERSGLAWGHVFEENMRNAEIRAFSSHMHIPNFQKLKLSQDKKSRRQPQHKGASQNLKRSLSRIKGT